MRTHRRLISSTSYNKEFLPSGAVELIHYPLEYILEDIDDILQEVDVNATQVAGSAAERIRISYRQGWYPLPLPHSEKPACITLFSTTCLSRTKWHFTICLEPFVEYTPWAKWIHATAVEKMPKDDPAIMGLYNSEIIDSRLDCRSTRAHKMTSPRINICFLMEGTLTAKCWNLFNSLMERRRLVMA